MARRLRLTKKTAIIFGAVIVILSGALGYLLWRVNQTDTTAPTDSSAGSCNYYSDSPLWGLEAGWYNCYYDDPEDASSYSCDACTPSSDPSDGDGTDTADYASIDDCQPAADQANAGEDPDFLSRDNACPITGVKWICDDRTDGTGYDLISVACTPEDGTDTGDSEPVCGEEPTNYSYNSAPTSQIGPFPKDGKVVLLYKSLNDADYRPLLTFTGPDGQSHSYKMPTLDSNKRAEVTTEIEVSAGDYITLVSSNDDRDQGDPECAPTTNNPKYMSFGWIAPQSGLCGSGLDGPPTGGTQTPMDKKSISADVSWAEGLGYDIVDNKGQQCWADWREWPGDYDFEDYFLMISYEEKEVIIETNPDWDMTKEGVKTCIDDNTQDAVAEVMYTITVENTGDGDGEITKVVDTLDESILDSFVVTDSISDSGVYSDGVITWDFTSSPLSIAAGESKELTYKIQVDSDHFAVYGNSVELTPVGSEKIQATETVTAVCTVPGGPVIPGEVPETGLFDSTISRVIAGFIMVILGGVVYNMPAIRKDQYKYRERFEKKVANK